MNPRVKGSGVRYGLGLVLAWRNISILDSDLTSPAQISVFDTSISRTIASGTMIGCYYRKFFKILRLVLETCCSLLYLLILQTYRTYRLDTE